MTWYMFPKDQSDPFLPPLFQFDATETEESQSTAEVTKVPIEDRATIADHSYTQPDVHTVEGMLSPLLPFPSPRGVVGVTGAVKKAVDALKAGTVLTCVFGFEVADLLLTSVSRSLGADDGFALRVSLELIELRTVTTETISVPPSRLRRSIRRKAAQRKGGTSTAPTALDEAAAEQIVKNLPQTTNILDTETIAQPLPGGP
ncbi:MAG: hypothetical protein V3V34_11795 [Kiloniellales bacterium]